MSKIFNLGKFGATIELDSSQFDKGLSDAERSIKKTSGGLKGFASSVGKIAAGIGVFKVVDKAFSMITGSVDRAISRVDILNQFPKVLQQMGYGADEAERATTRLSEGIDGLPTTLDGITGTTQRMITIFKDVDLATESALALNNAFLASGSSQADASRGLEQYTQMLSSGAVDMQSWRTLQETMPYALEKTAEAFGFTGKSAQNDFYEALKNGDVTMDDFNSKVIELSEAQGGFAEVALEATKGIGTSWANIQTAIANGVANSISAFDTWLESAGFGGIAGVLDRIKSAIGGVFSTVNNTIPVVLDWFGNLYAKVAESTAWTTFREVVLLAVEAVQGLWEKFQDTGVLETVKQLLTDLFNVILEIDFKRIVEEVTSFLETWSPLIAGIAAGIATFKLISGAITLWTAATTLWTTVTAIATGVGTAFGAVLAFITSPIGLVVIAIGLLVAAGVLLYKNWDTVKAKLGQLWNSVSNFFGKIGSFIGETWTKVVSSFKTLLTNASSIFNAVKNAIMNPINSAKSTVISAVASLYSSAVSRFNQLRSSASNVFNAVKSAIMNPINSAKDAVGRAINAIKNFFSGLKLSFPKIKMPKLPSFSLSGKFNLAPPSVPKLKVNWNADGGVFTRPQIFNTANAGLQGVGEAGAEAIIPLRSDVLAGIGKGISMNMPHHNNHQQNQATSININPTPVYLDGEQISEILFDNLDKLNFTEMQLKSLMTGGDL